MAWPLVSREAYNQIVAERDALQEQLNDLAPAMGYISLGQEIHKEVSTILEEDPATRADVVALAFERVRLRETDKARQQQSILYEAEHRTALYAQVLEEVDRAEGTEINEAAKRRVECDAELAAKLQDSARKELLLRSENKIAQNITEAQEAAIQAEVERQMELDRFDVEFALGGRIDLSDPRITNRLESDDKLIIFFETENPTDKSRVGVMLSWKKDEINNTFGWVVGGTVDSEINYETVVTTDISSLPKDKYARSGSQLNDFTNGEKVIKDGLLARGQPLVLSWNNRNGKEQQQVIEKIRKNRYQSYHTQNSVGKVIRIDFQTRDLQFVQ